LQENLKYYVEKELYEECTQIVEAINQLKEKPDGTKNPDTPSRKNKKKETK
jgi:protein-arginine kinase activator protein McsA